MPPNTTRILYPKPVNYNTSCSIYIRARGYINTTADIIYLPSYIYISVVAFTYLLLHLYIFHCIYKYFLASIISHGGYINLPLRRTIETHGAP